MRREVYLVTKNKGKLKEVKDIFAPFSISVKSIYEVYDIGKVEEKGESYTENALLKARAGFAKTGEISLGEDSGLEVDYLQGAPGLYSARFGGENASSEDKISLLLQLLQEVPPEERIARFVCVVALVWRGGEETFRGVCEGYIAEEPRGNAGFGYDPIFIFPEEGKTFAQLGSEFKNRYSHRSRAFHQCAEFLAREVFH
ncbi:MAG: RdgB/HAM1 family non-canonical purine NTP pyrophosphatase [Candidatus Atribacteria bacterium]|nr:RdgB/HAM1 family non-canonical purine NTP pyrophosphatase [Candidatus Atribacteria bacterium]